MNTHKFAPFINILILASIFTPVYAQYGPVLTNPSAPYIPQSVAPGQYNPVITTPGTVSPYSTTTTSGTSGVTSGTTGWNGWGGSTTSGVINNGAYGAQSISPTTSSTAGTAGTSSTGWNGWGGSTTSGYINNGSYSPTISSPGVSYTGGGTIATSSTGWNGWNTNGTAGSTTTTSTTGTSATTTATSSTTGTPSSLANVSTLGSTYVGSQVATVSGAWLSSVGNVGTWFEYGTSENGFTDRTTGYQQTNASGSWSEQLAGLTPNTTYYYRAVTENTFGKNYGAIRSFKTRALVVATSGSTSGTSGVTSVTGTTTTTTTGTATGTVISSTGAINITNRYTNVCPDDDVDYAINYKNTTGRKLNNVVIKIYLPSSIEYRSSTTGTYRLRENSVTVIVGTLNINESGIVYVTGQATNDVRGTQINGKAEITYDGQNGTKIKEEALVTNMSEDCDNSSLGAAAFWGTGFFPTTFLGWLLLFLFILFLIWISRRFMYRPAHHSGDHSGGAHH